MGPGEARHEKVGVGRVAGGCHCGLQEVSRHLHSIECITAVEGQKLWPNKLDNGLFPGRS